MFLIDWIKDWISFRSMVTPVFLKVLFHALFWIMNIGGILMILIYFAMGVLSVLSYANNDLTSIIVGLLVVLLGGVAIFGILVLYNFVLRVYFELLLLFFNMYDSLKSIERSLANKK